MYFFAGIVRANRRFVPCQVLCISGKTEIVRTWAGVDSSLAISGYIQQNRHIGILIGVLRKWPRYLEKPFGCCLPFRSVHLPVLWRHSMFWVWSLAFCVSVSGYAFWQPHCVRQLSWCADQEEGRAVCSVLSLSVFRPLRVFLLRHISCGCSRCRRVRLLRAARRGRFDWRAGLCLIGSSLSCAGSEIVPNRIIC